MMKSTRIRWEGYVARIGREGECIYDIGGEARRKETSRKTWTKWEDNIEL
jgi:hypothetical protein